MEKRVICELDLERFRGDLVQRERALGTVEKYVRAVRRFWGFLLGRDVTREVVLAYKEELGVVYSASGANSMIAALNAFFRFMGWDDLCAKPFRVQRAAYLPEKRVLSYEEYRRLVNTARVLERERIGLILQTICATGIRVSELSFITVEAVRTGKAMVRCKGKSREVFLVEKICTLLTEYMQRQGIESGAVFITRSGKPMSRVAIWRDMKGLCHEAGVDPQKVFPHNLRHLFARVFYSKEKDLAKLADILGHSSINTTRIYIAESGAEHRRQMERLDLVIDTPKAEKPKPKGKRRNPKRA